MIELNGERVKRTLFPDGTSQVWKLPNISNGGNNVRWWFESEDELIHLQQLRLLLRFHGIAELTIPYLPYARQDKSVLNDATFALHAFAVILNSQYWDFIRAVDVHSQQAEKLIHGLESELPDLSWIEDGCTVVFPDKGASVRYRCLIETRSIAIGRKVRDQQTGQILEYALESNRELRGARVVVVDDLCDGGATFLMLADALAKAGVESSDLYVTHGLFSRGFEALASKYRRLITTNTVHGHLLRDPEHRGAAVKQSVWWRDFYSLMDAGRLSIREVVLTCEA